MFFVSKIINTIKERYCNLPKTIKATVWILFANLLARGISFLVAPIYTRLMPAEEYGKYAVYTSWYSIISIFSLLSLNSQVYYKGITKYQDDMEGYTSSLVGLSWAATAIVFIILGGVRFLGEGTLFNISNSAFVVMIVESVFTGPQLIWMSRKRYDYDYKPMVALVCISTLVVPIVAIPAINFSSNKGDMAIISRVITLMLFYLVPTVALIRKNQKIYDWNYWKYALRFTLPLIPHQLSCILLAQSDRIMIDKLCGGAEAAIYSVATSISSISLLFSTCLFEVFSPWFYKKMKDNGVKNIRRIVQYLLIIVAVVNLSVAFFSPDIIRLLFPKNYAEAIPLLPILVTSNYFIFCYQILMQVEYYYEETRIIMITSVIIAIMNIVLNIYFIKIFGYTVAAFTTLFCYMVYVICHFFLVRRVCKIYRKGENIFDPRSFWILFLGVAIFSILATYTTDVLYPKYVILILSILLLVWKRRNILESINEILGRAK